jgi:small subunit ribosomal protein S11
MKQRNRVEIPKLAKIAEASIGVMNIRLSFNNTLITLCDLKGNCIAWFSAGMLGLKGGRKSSLYALQISLEKMLDKAERYGYESFSIRVSGIGPGRKFVLRYAKKLGLRVISLENVTPKAHNGCRIKRKRRL